jgi:ribosomal protein L15E
MSRYALEDAESTTNPGLKALYEAHSRQWLALAEAARRSPEATAPSLRASGFDHAA